MNKSLDAKLSRISADPTCSDFILADAKDADMAFGLAAPGRSGSSGAAIYRSLAEYRDAIREIVKQGLIDICLMSASTHELLALDEELFVNSTITPAVRMNDTTDIWLAGSSASYGQQPSLPFRSATINHVACGKHVCTPEEHRRGTNLGLYSVTFNNDATLDRATLEAYQSFRLEAEEKAFRHFLEIFPPNACRGEKPADIGLFLNNHIVRLLAGITRSSRPIFLKMPYCGAESLKALCHYDPTIVVGILGGSSGTTHDAFHLLWEAKQHGARAALFGRKINDAEHQLTFVRLLRKLADGSVEPRDAVHTYHAELKTLGLQPKRSLTDDLKLTVNYSTSYAS